MSRRHRFVAACLAAFALVFAQGAVSAHACALAGPAEMPEVSANHDCCPGTIADADGAEANLCLLHCAYGNASVDNSADVPAALEGGSPGLRVALPEPVTPGAAGVEGSRAEGPVGPPAILLFGVLRI
jgi:hypothetical protein